MNISRLLVLPVSCLIMACESKTSLFQLVPAERSNIQFDNRIIENDSINPFDVTNMYNGAGVGVADFNNDGFPDLFVCNGASATIGTNMLFQNNANRNGWLKVVLQGTQSNRSGIGAKLFLKAKGKTQYREYTGQHYMSQNYIPVHFGLGRAIRVNSLSVTWPSGTRQRLTDIAINQTITVIEP